MAKAAGSGMARTWVRILYEFAECSQSEVSVAKRSGDGKFLGLFRGGGGSLAKL